MPIPISQGSGASSIASEKVGTSDYQQIKVVGGETGSTSVMGVNPDRSINVSVIGTVTTSIVGTVPVTQSGTMIASVEGTVASGSADSGNPVKIGAKNNTTLPTFTDGQRGDLQIGTRGALYTTLMTNNSTTAITSRADNVEGVATSATANNLGVISRGTVYNGVGWDRQAGNSSIGTLVSTGASSVITLNIGSIATVPTGNQSVSGTVTVNQGTNAGLGSRWPTIITNGSQTADVSTTSMLSVAVKAMTSIVGTYLEDAAFTTGDPGVFMLHPRNDTMSSITSADLDYSGAAVGPVGEMIVANAPITKWVQGTASMLGGTPVNGGSVTVIAAQGASIFTYITSGQVTNASSNNVFLTLSGATSSIIAYLPVPANSGALPIMINGWKTNANGAFTASISGVASVYLSFQGFISNT